MLLAPGWALYEHSLGELGLLVFLTSVLVPGMVIVAVPVVAGAHGLSPTVPPHRVLLYSAARAGFDRHAFWARVPDPKADPGTMASGAPTHTCHTCRLLVLRSPGHEDCDAVRRRRP